MQTILPTAPPQAVNLDESDVAFGMIEEAVKELGVRFEGTADGVLLFKRGRFDPTQNMPFDELSDYIFRALTAISNEVPEVRDALTRISHDGIRISIS